MSRPDLVARINRYLAGFAGTTPVPDSERHRITRPPLSGSPESVRGLLEACKEALT